MDGEFVIPFGNVVLCVPVIFDKINIIHKNRGLTLEFANV